MTFDTGPQFDAIVFDLNPPKGNISPPNAPQGQRVAELLTWLEGPMGPGLDILWASLIPQGQTELYQFLLKLPGPQFDAVVFNLNPPPGNISPPNAPQGQRVADLFAWLKSSIGPGLDILRSSLAQVLSFYLIPPASFTDEDSSLLQKLRPGALSANRYRIVKILGQSLYGVTYYAQDTVRPGDPYCVLKQLSTKEQNRNLTNSSRKQFQTVAETLEKLGHHPQIPRLLAYYEHNNTFFLVQEHIEGKTLFQKIKNNNKLAEAEVISFLRSILPVVKYIHENKVMHRDIKPPNIIHAEAEDRLYLINFGSVKEIAQELDSERKDNKTISSHFESSIKKQTSQESIKDNFFVGTPGFAPPEQVALKPVYASDIYALGMTCIYLLTGRAPIEFDYDPITGEMLWTNLIDFSPDFRQVIQKMIKVNVAERYKSIDALERDLSGVNAARSRKSILYEVFDEKSRQDYHTVYLKSPLESILIGSEFEIRVGLNLEPYDQAESIEVQIPNHDVFDKELNLLLSSPDFQISGSSEASLPLGSDLLSTSSREIRFHLTALRAGSLKLFLEVYLNEEFKGKIQRTLDVQDFDENGESVGRQLLRSRPVSHPDLIIQAQGCYGDNFGFQLNYQLTNFTSLHALDELSSFFKVIQADLTERFRRELSLAVEKTHAGVSQSKEQLVALSSLGQTLFQRLLPQDVQDELRSVRRFSRPASLMILADQATWLPWEIMHDGQHFLGDHFILGRWPLEISDKRPYEFAIGSVTLAHYANVERTEKWLDLLDPSGSMPPSVMQQGIFEDLGLAEVLQGLHLVRQGERGNDLDERIDAPVAIQEAHTAGGVEEQLRPGKLNLRRNRPIVSLSYLQNGHKELTNIETAWVPAFLRAGCSAFIGSLWSVRPEVEAAFISNFYSNLWAGNNLGLAFYKAKQMAKVAVPESADWLAYVLYGDPMARPYRPVEGRGYAVVEAVGHDLDQPVATGSTLRFRASLRRKPPIWYENRLMDVTEALNFDALKVYIVASGIEVKPSDCIQMRRTPDGDYLGWFNLSIPSGLAGQTSLVQVHFEDGDDPIQSQRLTLKVAEA
ncbi:serine/threonine-protein kinase [Nodosilinea sp. LEGE 07298]|uniref:serine/threonine-protein kinase n=1 Tax=Nodosilinea sp. LEGE 07298 TaxID=2777970 RepID=UPI00187E6EEB|nr:serine/threonine-protein kinase [Nodosilinea sp. LEGE 07298]